MMAPHYPEQQGACTYCKLKPLSFDFSESDAGVNLEKLDVDCRWIKWEP